MCIIANNYSIFFCFIMLKYQQQGRIFLAGKFVTGYLPHNFAAFLL